MKIRREFVDLATGQVHYRTAGRSDPILCIHASPGSSRQLVPLLDGLAHAFRVIAPDTPGHGDSEPFGRDNPTIVDFAARLPALLDALAIDRKFLMR